MIEHILHGLAMWQLTRCFRQWAHHLLASLTLVGMQ